MLRSLAKFWSHFFNKSRRKLHVGAGSETPQSPIIHQLHWCDWWSGCWLVRYYIYIQYMCIYIYIWRFPKIEVPPKSSILRGFSIINHPCWDIPIYWNHHIYLPKNNSVEWSCDYDNSGKVWLTIVNVGYVWAPGCFNWRKVQPAIH